MSRKINIFICRVRYSIPINSFLDTFNTIFIRLYYLYRIKGTIFSRYTFHDSHEQLYRTREHAFFREPILGYVKSCSTSYISLLSIPMNFSDLSLARNLMPARSGRYRRYMLIGIPPSRAYLRVFENNESSIALLLLEYDKWKGRDTVDSTNSRYISSKIMDKIVYAREK